MFLPTYVSFPVTYTFLEPGESPLVHLNNLKFSAVLGGPSAVRTETALITSRPKLLISLSTSRQTCNLRVSI